MKGAGGGSGLRIQTPGDGSRKCIAAPTLRTVLLRRRPKTGAIASVSSLTTHTIEAEVKRTPIQDATFVITISR